jgi:ribosomal protein L37E
MKNTKKLHAKLQQELAAALPEWKATLAGQIFDIMFAEKQRNYDKFGACPRCGIEDMRANDGSCMECGYMPRIRRRHGKGCQ